MSKKRTILLYGRTRGGKTTQIGMLAEHVYKTTGKTTRLYTCDKGGLDAIQPYVDLGIIEVVEVGTTPVLLFLNKAVRGMVRDKDNKWVTSDLSKIGLVAFESMTAFADGIMSYMCKEASEGKSIGGGANVSFTVTGDGESIKVGGSNMAMYGIAQSRITDEVWESQKLPVDYILWTASASKDEDQTAGGKVIGPAVIGKALTSEVPRWFNLCFRIDALPASTGKAEKHVLYLGNNVDLAAGNATALGNTRTAFDSTPLPTSIEPASIVEALKKIDATYAEALTKIKARMNVPKT